MGPALGGLHGQNSLPKGFSGRGFHLPNPLNVREHFQAPPEVRPEMLNGRPDASKFRRVGQMLQQQAMFESAKERLGLGQRAQFGDGTSGNAPNLSTLPVEEFLRDVFVEGKVLEKMNPQLLFLDMASRFTTTAKDITWFRHAYSADNDPKIRRPTPIRPGAVFPRTLVSDPEKQFASVGMWGIAIDFTREELRFTNQAVDSIQRKINAVTYDMTREVNAIYGNTLTNDFDASQTGVAADDQVVVETASNVWSDSSANPIEDIRDLTLSMETTAGYYYSPTELWLTPTSYRELLDYLTTIDHQWSMDPRSGQPIRQIDDITIRKAPEGSGIPDGSGIMLARGAGVDSPLTVWDAIDSDFTRSGILHTQTFRNPETLITTVKIWKEFAVVNRNPKAVGLLSGI